MPHKAPDEGRQEGILGWILEGVTSINDSTRVKTDSIYVLRFFHLSHPRLAYFTLHSLCTIHTSRIFPSILVPLNKTIDLHIFQLARMYKSSRNV